MRKPVRLAAAGGRPVPDEKFAPFRLPLADSPGFLVRVALLRAFDEFHRNFAGLGVTPAGYSVLALIESNPGIRPGAIAEELRVKPSNVAALVNALVAADLVSRDADQSELRASLLRITPAGRKLWQEMQRAHHQTDVHFVAPLTPAERKQLLALLRKIVHR